MNLLDHFSGADWQSLASTLLHTLWQGAVAALALAAALRFANATRPNLRYLLSLRSTQEDKRAQMKQLRFICPRGFEKAADYQSEHNPRFSRIRGANPNCREDWQ